MKPPRRYSLNLRPCPSSCDIGQKEMKLGGRLQVAHMHVPGACLVPGSGPRWLCLVGETKMPKRLNKSLSPEGRTSVRRRSH